MEVEVVRGEERRERSARRRRPNESWVRLGQVDVISSERSVINIKLGPLLRRGTMGIED